MAFVNIVVKRWNLTFSHCPRRDFGFEFVERIIQGWMCHLLIHDHENRWKNWAQSDLAWNSSGLALRGTKVSPLPNTDVSASVRCISDGIVTTSFVVMSAFRGPLASGMSVFVPVGLLRTPKSGQPKRISFLFLSQINWRCNREFNSWIKCLI